MALSGVGFFSCSGFQRLMPARISLASALRLAKISCSDRSEVTQRGDDAATCALLFAQIDIGLAQRANGKDVIARLGLGRQRHDRGGRASGKNRHFAGRTAYGDGLRVGCAWRERCWPGRRPHVAGRAVPRGVAQQSQHREPLGGHLVRGIYLQHLLQAVRHLGHAIGDASQPKPSLRVARILVDNVTKQRAGDSAVTFLDGSDGLAQQYLLLGPGSSNR